MKPKDAENWKKSREEGKKKFVLRQGVLAWGVPMFLLTCFMYPPSSVVGYMAMTLWWMAVSAGYGTVVWHLQEKAFSNFAQKHGKP